MGKVGRCHCNCTDHATGRCGFHGYVGRRLERRVDDITKASATRLTCLADGDGGPSASAKRPQHAWRGAPAVIHRGQGARGPASLTVVREPQCGDPTSEQRSSVNYSWYYAIITDLDWGATILPTVHRAKGNIAGYVKRRLASDGLGIP